MSTISVPHRVTVIQQAPYPLVVPAPEPAPVPPATGSTLWVDGSNYTGELTPKMCSDLKDAGYVGMILQAITGLDGRSYTRQQLQMCLDQGLRIAGYVWCWGTPTVSSRLRMFDGFALESLWLDVEDDTDTIPVVERDLALCDAYQGGITGIYSGRWFFAQQGWLGFPRWSAAGRPLWDSDYDGVPDVDYGFTPYGGWTQRAIKQFQGTSQLGSVSGIDLNVMR